MTLGRSVGTSPASAAPAGPGRDALYAQVRSRALSLDWAAPVVQLDTIYVSHDKLEIDAGRVFVDPRRLATQ